MDTNYFGPMSIIRLVLPAMRQRHSGTIVNFSSTAGLEARATCSSYSSSKWALEAASEALHEELMPLGIKVLIVSPGVFATKFVGSIIRAKAELPEEYKGTITEQMLKRVTVQIGTKRVRGDVEKGASAVFDVITRSGQAEGIEEFLRLPLGKDGISRWRIKLDGLQRTIDGTEKIWNSTDMDE
jgi:NAD(P)-dependent dehydrogenase (short-subunit alcohol dehydrogenase family)